MITVEEMNALAGEIKDLEEEYETRKKSAQELSDLLDRKYDLATEKLMELGQSSFRTPVGTLTTKVRRSFKVPHGSNREEFFSKLKDMGVFDDLITVNSNTLNSFLKAEYEAAAERGEDMVTYKFAGVEPPTEKVITSLLKAR